MIIQIEENTIHALINRSFSEFEPLPAIGFVDEKPMTYGELKEAVMKLSTRLISRHIGKGDKIAILDDNCPNWVIAYLAATSIGATAVPILPGFPESDVRHIIRNSGSSAVFISDKYRPYLDDMGKSSLHTLFSMNDFSVTELKKQAPDPLIKITAGLKKELGREPSLEELSSRFPKPGQEDLAAIIYTSGTTGHSKGVMLTHGNIASDVVFSIEKFPIDTKDRFLSILPLAHTFEATGGMLCALSAGVNIFYMKGLPTPKKLLSSMASAKPTGVLTVPLVIDKVYRKKILPRIQSKKVTDTLYKIPLFRKLLNKVAGKKLIDSFGGQLRFFMFGGASLNEDVEVFLRDAAISYSTGYGMTETSPIMTINPFGKVKVGSCGQPIPGIEMKIHNPSPDTGIGEIIVKGPMVMRGYYKNPEATGDVFFKDGWLRTGDLGYFDSAGYLFIKGRSKNVIIGPSGENIYAEIIEQQFLQNPYIQEIVIYRAGNKLTAKVYLDHDVLDQAFDRKRLSDTEAATITKEILEQTRREMNQSLPAFSHVNEIIEHPEPFEKTPTQKVKRYLYIPQE